MPSDISKDTIKKETTIKQSPNVERSTSNSDTSEASVKEDIGSKIHQLRLAKGYSQRKLASLAGLTNTAISAIERNKVSPAVNTLDAILKVLESDLQTFFSSDWNSKQSKKVVIKPDDLIELKDVGRGVSLKMVHNNCPSLNLGFLIEEYQPNSSTEERIIHEGEEIGTVISGEIVMRYNGVLYHLKSGDSYVIDTSLPHTFMNPSDGITRIISAHSPATY
ncbi:HTH-type transcriptional regulator PuuR [Psychrobacter sp. HD31]|uniref:HTH-type transcriptional regulator PuuR n=1 Tax=Psychrobacter sp. HD31 TaxID=3112003 RepID=UPI003DA2FA9A